MKFQNYNHVEVDLLSYCADQKKKHSGVKVHIGTDSIQIDAKIKYVAVVAFRHGTNGAHFIYHRESIIPTKKNSGKWGVFMKLRHEAELSIEIANQLVDAGIFTKDEIVLELDFNNIVDTLYKGLIPEIRGLASHMGFDTLVKFKDDTFRGKLVTEDLIAVKAADYICRGYSPASLN